MQKKIGTVGNHLMQSHQKIQIPQPGQILRLYGDSPEPVLAKESWRSADGYLGIEAPLPKGYPAPTPSGCIEVKTYPSIRRAEIKGRDVGGEGNGFWPLFQHIQSRNIAMTSPVEVDYEENMINDKG